MSYAKKYRLKPSVVNEAIAFGASALPLIKQGSARTVVSMPRATTDRKGTANTNLLIFLKYLPSSQTLYT
jgi:hypothetical protein